VSKEFSGYLPDGKFTRSTATYIKEWGRLKNQIERRLKLKTIAFDPDLLMRDASPNATRQTVSIPVWLAKRILEANS
jgi:hypothetical protein